MDKLLSFVGFQWYLAQFADKPACSRAAAETCIHNMSRNDSFEGHVFQKLKNPFIFALIRLVRIRLQTTRAFVRQIQEE
ncbi:hypothetical protein ALC60_01084 [Trachymyrmex zeteki]|uniref:Uncharacterized protein n=1 Tax=Mycetomoellerius zeteki TaxID=64791 RepID=A0A151XHX6_9HYME|nr:hypothetical protein ALC60_01084 [Trachymyrmex zeteki]